ncbi:hypothetical protein NMG46_04865 [Mesorhizobium sp. LMG 17147]|uniref:hypothetical protein n=1 Tax=Mesorhizobium sp. LMG 17147 TaxID=2963091 RepID=UPI0020C98C67|nr:hypothetical protein [Mesorhizobium sp. LMG 17147]MCP9229584.1 hypothetical protein [Mesorhizobium sp. LMG 17147]
MSSSGDGLQHRRLADFGREDQWDGVCHCQAPSAWLPIFECSRRDCTLIENDVEGAVGERQRSRHADQISAAESACSGPWVEIYARRELQYQKLLKRAKLVPRLVIKLGRRTANPPADF